MELKLNIYADEYSCEVEKVATANAFKLSVGVCEDILTAVNIDMFEGGLESLSDESTKELAIGIVKNGYPVFKELIKGIFKLSDSEMRRVAIEDMATVVIQIVKYSFNQLANSLGGQKQKN